MRKYPSLKPRTMWNVESFQMKVPEVVYYESLKRELKTNTGQGSFFSSRRAERR